MESKPGSLMPAEERVSYFTAIRHQFLQSIVDAAPMRYPDPRDAIVSRLVAVNRWLPDQARQVADQDIPLSLPVDWQAFWNGLDPNAQQMLLAWPEEHGLPVPNAAKRQ
ncbi:hypothetical protein GC176_23095 [bacterium]|nr:hypothetical protein [bacterium]